MQGRVSVFSSGKLISTGGKSILGSIEQLKLTLMLLVENNFVTDIPLEPKVQNIVATLDMHKKLDLNGLVGILPHALLEPDQFPAIIVRTDYNTTCLIFSSGKVVISGGKSEQDLYHSSKFLLESI